MVKIKIKSKEPVYQEKKRGKTFEYYPEFNDPNFYEKIYTKKEFYKNEIPVQTKTAEEICKAMPFELAPQQQFLRNYISVDTPYNGVLIYHKTGVGKCLAYDTPVLMRSGEFKKVQNLQVGDYLMGDDSQGREILSLARGIDKMYKINIENGISFTVNSEHIICVRPEHPQIIKKDNDTYYVKYLDEMKIKKDRFFTLNEAESFSNRIEFNIVILLK